MGQKVHPKVFRIGAIYQANSRWFARQSDYAKFLQQDIQIRKYLKEKLSEAGIAKIEIERSPNKLDIIINTIKPGVIIGRGGTGIEDLKKSTRQKFRIGSKINVNINIQEVEKPDLNAELIKQSVIGQLEKRVPFRRAVKRVISQVMRAGAQGVKVIVAGRLNGAEIARTETFTEGKIPLHTIRADIDYSRGAAHTIYGLVGVKVWIYRGEIFSKDNKKNYATTKKS
jgi:small subunit ribosomal protein S3